MRHVYHLRQLANNGRFHMQTLGGGAYADKRTHTYISLSELSASLQLSTTTAQDAKYTNSWESHTVGHNQISSVAHH